MSERLIEEMAFTFLLTKSEMMETLLTQEMGAQIHALLKMLGLEEIWLISRVSDHLSVEMA